MEGLSRELPDNQQGEQEKKQWPYIMLLAGREGKDLRDSWQLDNTTKEDPEAQFAKYQTHFRGAENKWVRRLELSAITQQENESTQDFYSADSEARSTS